jgi:hypothetical protein
MNFFSSWLQSWRRSSKRSKLQSQIYCPKPLASNPVTYVIMLLSRRSDDGDRALADYLDLCESDEAVAKVMEMEQLSRSSLIDIYGHLLTNGLDRWVKGHHAALSSIAYPEPLYLASRAPNKGMSWREIAFSLLEYWEHSIPEGELWDRVK